MSAGQGGPERAADLAEAFEQGRAAERAFMERLAAYHHWSSISAGPPDLPTNPYRTSPGQPGGESDV